MKNQTVVALVRAHFEGDEERFLALCKQLEADAAGSKHHAVAYDIRRATHARPQRAHMVQLPQQAAGLLEQTLPQEGLSSLVLPTYLRAALDQVLAERARAEALEAAGLQPARRVLLAGPTGTGKTSTAAALAAELRLPLLSVRLGALVDSHMGETARHVQQVCATARATAAVVFLDELDSIGSARQRDSGSGREQAHTVNALLQALDAPGGAGLLVGATNAPGDLDAALVRRFDVVLEYHAPGPEEAAQVAQRRAARVPGAAGVDWAALGLRAFSGQLSHAAVVAAVEHAGKAAVLAGRALTTEAVAEALDGVRAGLRAA